MRLLSATSVHTWTVICSLVLCQLGIAMTAGAQQNNPQQRNPQARGNQANQQQQQLRFVKLSGQIANLQQGAISVNADNKSYIVQLHPQKTRVTVVGETSVEALQPGVLVQFDSLLNPRLTLAKAPIESLTILSPSSRTRPGVISDTPKDLTNPFTVRGTIKRIIGPQMTVEVSRKQVRADLAEEASVDVEVSDFSLVANGDKIEVKGAEVNPGLVHATDVRIMLSKPLGESDTGDKADEQTKPRSKSRQRAAAQKKR